MKKFLALLLLLFLTITACNSAAQPETTVPDVGRVAPPPAQPTASEPTSVGAESAVSFSAATTIEAAAVIRPHDHVIGADEPVVAIIEYGDYQ